MCGAPYYTVAVLTGWAAVTITNLDGTLTQQGLDLHEQWARPANRWIALLYSIVLERISWVSDEDERRKAIALLEWDDVTEASELAEQDRMAREAAEALGVSFEPSDWQQAWEARQAALAAMADESADQGGASGTMASPPVD